MNSPNILRAESFSLTAAISTYAGTADNALTFLRVLFPDLGQLPSQNRLWEFWRDVCDKGSDEERQYVQNAEAALAQQCGAAEVLEKYPDCLLPHHRVRLAALAWPTASATDRARLAVTIRRSVTELTEKYWVNSALGGYFTRSQSAALRRVVQLGNAFFNGLGEDLPIRPRYQPLMAGPTGSGKTEIARQAAAKLDATLFKVSIADWIPQGAHAENWTLYSLLDTCREHDRVLLFVDELDKARSAFSTSWMQGIMAEVFATLDKAPPLHGYCRKHRVDERQLGARLRKILFCVGAGTWQEVWDRTAMGFGAESATPSMDDIMALKAIPEELLLRFCFPPIALSYPEPEEAVELFEKAGIVRLAEVAGISFNPKAHDFSRGGIRSIENLITDLLLRASFQSPSVPETGKDA